MREAHGDLSRPIRDEEATHLRRELVEHVVLLFRGQSLTPASLLRAAHIFGEPMQPQYSEYNLSELPQVNVISEQEGVPPQTYWHADHTNFEQPPSVSLLYCVAAPASGGGTSVLNARDAFASLSAAEQQRLLALRTVNGVDPRFPLRAQDAERCPGRVRHPLVRTHPVSGTRSIYFSPSKLHWIEGMDAEASQAFVREILASVVSDRFVYRHRWRAGDLLVIDQRSSLHRAEAGHEELAHRSERKLLRVLVGAERPF
jgi:taurine dioxygenase